MPMTKEERKAYGKIYYKKNIEKIKAYRDGRKALDKEYKKVWYIKNKEKLLDINKTYYKEHKEELNKTNAVRAKAWQKTSVGIRSAKKSNWKRVGLILQEGQTFDGIYERYINTHKCDICRTPFRSSRNRCMDHDHQTGFFRHILCCSCNNLDYWKKKQRKDAEIVIYRFIIDIYRK